MHQPKYLLTPRWEAMSVDWFKRPNWHLEYDWNKSVCEQICHLGLLKSYTNLCLASLPPQKLLRHLKVICHIQDNFFFWGGGEIRLKQDIFWNIILTICTPVKLALVPATPLAPPGPSVASYCCSSNKKYGSERKRKEETYLFRLWVTSCEHLEILCDGTSAWLAEFSCSGITHPAMDTTTTWVNPEQMLEPEIFSVS